jgi:glycosyltransferase involved in cell wall biosynthesis
MKKVLLITDVNFWQKNAGHCARIYSLVEYLAQNVQLTVVNTGPAPQNIESFLRCKFNAEFFILEKINYLGSNGYGRRLKAFIKYRVFDTIIIEYIHNSYFINFIDSEANIILDAHDIMTERYEEFKKYNYADNLYEISRKAETEMFNAYDYVLVLCGPDYKMANSMAPGKILICPHPVTPCIHFPRSEVKNITFVGSSYFPNSDAITFFIEHCWPQISEKYPINLTIYGAVCKDIRLVNKERIFLKGFVADQNQIYDEAGVIINPVRFGAGLKIKNIEALAHGLPLLTTTHGARGIEDATNKAFLVANNADEFIQSIVSLTENVQLRKMLCDNAHKFINDNFSIEKCFEPLISVINS